MSANLAPSHIEAQIYSNSETHEIQYIYKESSSRNSSSMCFKTEQQIDLIREVDEVIVQAW